MIENLPPEILLRLFCSKREEELILGPRLKLPKAEPHRVHSGYCGGMRRIEQDLIMNEKPISRVGHIRRTISELYNVPIEDVVLRDEGEHYGFYMALIDLPETSLGRGIWRGVAGTRSTQPPDTNPCLTAGSWEAGKVGSSPTALPSAYYDAQSSMVRFAVREVPNIVQTPFMVSGLMFVRF